MYNSEYPQDHQLPTSKQLFISTLGAIALALVLLVTAILPAEYGIDPTGTGKLLGLTQMGEIKTQLEQESLADNAAPITVETPEVESVAAELTAAPAIVPAAPVEQAVIAAVIPQERISVTLAPGEAAEIKLVMNKDDTVNYHWQVDTGHVNYDTHADNPSTRYHGYNKGKAVTEDKGILTAAFDGKHGWFWRNRSKEIVTVDLQVEGQFSEVVRVL
ncbi:hypothetical protein [Oceanicoccus sagamiensis]|uniref:Transmembrane anchor protein n=1 Tax=Oceanicoccus sagamiensis TaxID=716816 RepID=A0A1X9N6S5_9GAMM|nr:hypothetical protein [Oceanicoccus sagamiensis]ARN72941.1 hypothetical protein BST96_01765 [Oceanicoccus sagamiensis]